MPKKFTDCVKSGGKVRIKGLKGNKYIPVCYKNGTGTAGEVKKKKKKSTKK